MIQKSHVDGGKGFDFGRASEAYARYRDIYPEPFYQYLVDHGVGVAGQQVLDLGTGTGVLPRHMYRYGARFTGTDISVNQIAQAARLAKEAGMDIRFIRAAAEDTDFAEGTFDAVTACQCFTYFDHASLALKLGRVLKAGGRFAVLYMAWLPYEDSVARASEELVLRYSPGWTGCGETRHLIDVPPVYEAYFETESRECFDLRVPFTRESWNGRMLSCRGVGASLSEEETARFSREHMALLEQIAPERFEVLHYAAVTILRRR